MNNAVASKLVLGSAGLRNLSHLSYGDYDPHACEIKEVFMNQDFLLSQPQLFLQVWPMK